MRRLLPRTLFSQLVLGILLVQTLFLGLFISYIVVSQRRNSQLRIRERTVQLLNYLSAASSRQLAKGDMDSLRDVLNLSGMSTAIQIARLTDLNGQTLAVSQNGRDRGLHDEELAILKQAPRQQVFTIKNGQWEAVTPILSNGKPVALLWLEPNHAGSLNTANTIVRIAFSYGAFALLVNILPIFFIVRTMTKPLNKLREATHHLIRNPDRGGGFPLPVTTINEAGDLTVSFNTMVRELEQQRSGLMGTLALLDSMLANAPIGFGFFDTDLRYVRLNQYLADIYGLPIDRHLGQRSTELFPGSLARQMEAHLQQVFENGEAIRNVDLAGEPRQESEASRSWLMHFFPVQTQQETIRWVGVIAVEITERLKTEEALRKTEKLAAAGRLAASIAHEINNPLEAVTNLLYLLRTHETIDTTAMGFVATAEAELERVSEITQQTLRFYRQSTSPTPTRIAEVLDSVMKLYHSRITSTQITVTRKFRGMPLVFGLNGELRQVFANLIGNALDAMPNGGRLLLGAHPGRGRAPDGTWCTGVRISITDTGIGMSPETLRHAFEAFFTTKQATGTGLGLWLSEEIIRKHSGTVRVRSRTGRNSGTTFLAFFPDDGYAPIARDPGAFNSPPGPIHDNVTVMSDRPPNPVNPPSPASPSPTTR